MDNRGGRTRRHEPTSRRQCTTKGNHGNAQALAPPAASCSLMGISTNKPKQTSVNQLPCQYCLPQILAPRASAVLRFAKEPVPIPKTMTPTHRLSPLQLIPMIDQNNNQNTGWLSRNPRSPNPSNLALYVEDSFSLDILVNP